MKTFTAILKVGGIFTAFIFFSGAIAGSFGYVLKLKGQALPFIDWTTGIIGGIAGIILWLTGFMIRKKSDTKEIADVKAGIIKEVKPKLDINDLSFVSKSIKKTRKKNLIMGICLSVFGVFTIVAQVVNGTDQVGGMVILFVIAGLCLFIGFMAFLQFYKNRNIENSPMYKLLMMEPETVTGIKAQSVTSKYGAGIKFINATLFANNKQVGLLSVNENELELLKQYIEKHNSNLAFERTEVKA